MGEANQIILALGAELEHAEAPFVVRVPSGAEGVLWTKARQVPDRDLKIDLTQQQLQQLIGVPVVQQLVRYFPRKKQQDQAQAVRGACPMHQSISGPRFVHDAGRPERRY
jgi:hypothetical protein